MEGPSSKKQKKNYKSCIFCRRSHVNCDRQRPCSRCIKREIGHLCTAEENNQLQGQVPAQDSEREFSGSVSTPYNADGFSSGSYSTNNNETNSNNGGSNNNLLLPPQPNFVSENVGSEFSSLNEFLMMLENPLPMDSETNLNSGLNEYRTHLGNTTDVPPQFHPNANATPNFDGTENNNENNNNQNDGIGKDTTNVEPKSKPTHENEKPTSKEQFFLTAADPSTEMTPEDRLKLVINAKLEAGLLKPYDYAKGYARLQEYMDKYMSQSSKQRILKPLMSIRPAFRTIAKSLKDVDLVLVEESFERMLLSYDRVFTSMSMPACLWRRTGEIYRANKEFASLVDCTVDDLRDGKFAIYELMTEESAVNFWEKYGSIAFDKGQKAVLTSCSLRTKDGSKMRPCCFSFTIRRDRYNIPICIVGNFIPLSTTNEHKT
ncbi:Regulator of drug sensitivity 2 [Nakaseomyces bracarensis]|uniref:Regulator of drug sensitivity 2 n=1 Tax=Nakaseomyces bracarensis TaxID=273131 RepID=A0ABR4NU10_9SACH